MTNGATVDTELLRAIDTVADELNDPLLARQFELEEEMIEDGKHRYWDRVLKARPGVDDLGRPREGEESRTPASQCLLRMALNPVREGLREFLAAAETGKAGRRHMAVKHLKLVDEETAAFLSLKRCLDSFSLSPDVTNLCIRMGRTLEDEVRIRAFEKQAKPLLQAIQSRFKTANFKHHRRVLNALAQRHGLDLGEPWSKNEALQVGAALLTIVIERTGLFEIAEEHLRDGKTRPVVRPAPATQEWVRNRDASAQFLFPTFMPMVVPPRPWTTPSDGGYHFGLARKLRLVKNRNRGYQAELRHWDMPLVYRAVNALQETPWAVNHDVLRYMAPAARAGLAWTHPTRGWSRQKSGKAQHRNAASVIAFLGEDTLCREITEDHFNRAMAEFQRRNNSSDTVTRKLQAFYRLLWHAQKAGWIKARPEWERPTPGQPRMFIFSPELEAETIAYFRGVEQNERMAKLFMLGIDTGARLNELLAIEPRHVDLRSQFLTIVGMELDPVTRKPTPKNGEVRQVVLVDRAVDTLRELVEEARANGWTRLFHGFDDSMVSRLMRMARAELDDPANTEFTFHATRHTCGTRMAEAGLDVLFIKDQLGHKTLVMTMRYVKMSPVARRAAIRKAMSPALVAQAA